MGLLSLDPGVTTGVAVFDDHHKVVVSTAIFWDRLQAALNEIKVAYPAIMVIRERMPTQTYGPQAKILPLVIGTVDQMFPGAHQIAPTEWKNWAKYHAPAFPTADHWRPTQHQIDAYHMGMYYLSIREAA